MSEIRPPLWVRVTDVILGILAIIVSVFIMAFPVFILDLFILLIALGLVGLGLARILRGLFAKALSSVKRSISILVGFILLVGSLLIVLFPSIATLFVFWILAAILSALGLTRIFIGALTKAYPQKLKYILVILGVITLLLAFGAFVFPLTIGSLVIYLLAVGLLTAGIGRISLGLFGFK